MRNLMKCFVFLFFAWTVEFLPFPGNMLMAQNSGSGNLLNSRVDRIPITGPIASCKVSAGQNLLIPGHLYCKSSGTSVEINQANFGIGNVIAPPYFAFPFSGQFFIFNQPIVVSDFDWYPAGVSLTGKEVNGVASTMVVVPLWQSRGILAEITLQNQSGREIIVPAEWITNGQIGQSHNWEWYPPFAMKSNSADIQLTTRLNALEIRNSSTVAINKSPEFLGNPERPNSLIREIKLKSGERKSVSFVALLGTDADHLVQDADRLLHKASDIQADAFLRYAKILKNIESKVPELDGCSSELKAFYRKGLLTFSTCRWDVPEFISSPWYAESGIDGGALNNYCWGIAYVSRLMAMIDPPALRELLLAYARADLQKTYALNPADGSGMGVLYSYNYYSIARATHDYITITGDLGILNEQIANQSYLEYLYKFCLSREDLTSDPVLIDFGNNSNLLELRKTNKYCHFTPSPNAERLLIYQYLTDFYSWQGKITPDNLGHRAEKLKHVFKSRLWDSKNNWLFSLDQQQQPQTAFSMQIFDVLRTGILTKSQESALVAHLNSAEFLSAFGIHSLAKTDEGYDTSDVDWGGPGVYAGDAPELIEDLLHAGFVGQGIDLLNRILWWGQFPYYPQAIRADRMGYREDGRPNVIAGLAAPQSVIFGLFGITVGKDFISVNPVNHSFVKGMSLHGLTIRNVSMDISVSKAKNEFQVKVGTKSYQSISGKAIEIKLPDFLAGKNN